MYSTLWMFQSRNRETYDSNSSMRFHIQNRYGKFQSRNRETYDSNRSGVILGRYV